MLEQSASDLIERAAYFFRTWAPPVLAANGNRRKEAAALRRAGVRRAREEYDVVMEQLRQHEAESSRSAFRAVVRAAMLVDAGLARGAQ